MEYRFGGVVLDSARRRLLVDGQEVVAERQVFDLIVYLVEHRGRVCSRLELQDAVWGHRFVGDSSLTSRVKTARQLLQDDGTNQEVIRTVRGVGYEFIATITATSEASGIAAGTQISGNLPTPASSFVGRAAQVTTCVDLLGQTRLLTLVGPGGVGKTRLAIEVAQRVSNEFGGRKWLVELWQLDDPEQLPEFIASALGLQPQMDSPASDTLASGLAYSPALLILDTCEHLILAVSELVDVLLDSCPTLVIVVTSRQLLPSPRATVEPVEPLEDAAIELFTDRASATRFGFELTEDNEADVRDLCQRLDGIPLAIELAASRSATFSPRELAARVTQLDVGRPGLASGNERHGSLATALEWSYNTLSAGERSVFRYLSVFDGGFTVPAVEELGQASVDDPTAALEDLIDKSLVALSGQTDPGRRFTLLDTTRRFAASRLDSAGETEQTNRRHAEYYTNWLDDALQNIWGTTGVEVRADIVSELPNLRRAAGWALTNKSVDTASKLASVSGPANAAGRLDCAEWILPLLEVEGFDQASGAVASLRAAIPLAFGIGDVVRAGQLAERALAITEDPHILSLLAPILLTQAHRTNPPDADRLDTAWKHARQAVSLAPDDRQRLAVYPPLLFFLANETDTAEFHHYWRHFEQLLAETDSDLRWAWASNGAGSLAIVDPERARPIVERGLELSINFGLLFMTTRLRSHLAAIEARTGRPSRASELLLDAIVDDLNRGAVFTAWGWMHRLAALLATNGLLEEAVVLHHSIPPGQALIWAGDGPRNWLTKAQENLGDEPFQLLTDQGRQLRRHDLIPWLTEISARLPLEID